MNMAKREGIRLNKIHDYLWEIPRTGKMRVPGRVYASEGMLEKIKDNRALEQVVNVAHLEGIEKYSLAMPDIHWGYGFPIGGVAAMDAQEGVISPGGVGYDINCGVRLMTTNLSEFDIKPRLKTLVDTLFENVPCGLGIKGDITLNQKDYQEIIDKGALWAIERGYGEEDDLDTTEDLGHSPGGSLDAVSERAIERGKASMGTLGSGNHFLEVGIVDEIMLADVAEAFGLREGQVYALIHCGSRGFGHQICSDYIDIMRSYMRRNKIELPDIQLACAHINSTEARDYLSAFAVAVNYAWANRQVIMEICRRSFCDVFGITGEELGGRLVYDVSHNIVKFESHEINGEEKAVCIHRKGATRALPKGHPLIPEKYRDVGQPVFVPGDMGRASFVLVGTERGLDETFATCCHGAGRLLSRRGALRATEGRDVIKEMERRGVVVRARGRRTAREEIPEAYKYVGDVCDAVDKAGIARKVARLKPLGVIKG